MNLVLCSCPPPPSPNTHTHTLRNPSSTSLPTRMLFPRLPRPPNPPRIGRQSCTEGTWLHTGWVPGPHQRDTSLVLKESAFHPTRSLSLPWNKMKAPFAGGGERREPFLTKSAEIDPLIWETLNANGKSILPSPRFPGICFRYLKCICFDSRTVNKLMS